MVEYLADSNIWLRLAEPSHPMSTEAKQAIRKLLRRGDTLSLVPQVMTEYWRVVTATASQRGGFGWDTATAAQEVNKLEGTFSLREDTPAVYRQWKALVVALGISGGSVYDARLVAAMLAHGLTHILTFNDDDFRRYVPWGITPVNPRLV